MEAAAPDRTFTLITQKDGETKEQVVSIRKKKTEFNGCRHNSAVVDKALWRIECAECGESLDPIQFLIRLAEDEAVAEMRLEAAEREYKRINDILKVRMHTKCEHCGKSTKITGLGLWGRG